MNYCQKHKCTVMNLVETCKIRKAEAERIKDIATSELPNDYPYDVTKLLQCLKCKQTIEKEKISQDRSNYTDNQDRESYLIKES